MADWGNAKPASAEVKERRTAKKTRIARAKQTVKAIVTAIVPPALKPAPKPASTPANPHAGWSEQMRQVDRDLRNDFGDDHPPSFKRNKLGGWGLPGDGQNYTFTTHLPENR